MAIKKVTSNIKLGCDVEIGPKTVIVGPNGSGKSTIVNAIELAITGRASDIAGRAEVAREADLLSLAPAGEKLIYAEVEFDGGETARFSAEGTTAKAKKAVVSRPDFVQHEAVLPIRTLREAVLGSATTARKYLLSKVSAGTTRDDVKALLHPGVWLLWDKLIAAVDAGTPTADALVAVLEEAGKRQRAATEEAKTARGAARLVGDGYIAPPSSDDITTAKATVKAAREAYAKAEAAASASDRREEIAGRLEQASKRAQECALAFGAAKAEMEALPEIDDTELLECLEAVMAQSVARGSCLPCGGSADGITERLGEVRALLAESSGARDKREKAQRAESRAKVEAERALAVLESIEAEALALAQEPAVEKPDTEAAEAALDVAQKHLASLTAARDNWAVVQRSEATAQDAERRSAEWKSLKDACEGAVAVVLDKAVASFVAAVQSRLPASDKFDLRLRDGEREVVQFGLVRGGALHTALSGAEWARVTMAMAEACTPAGEFAVLIPEERAFDAKTLSGVLRALTDSPHQVIVASPVAPKPVPKGWTVIERGSES
jgi:energy-coupling factor transporter ATP-binding protein EcfA2